TRGAGDSAYSTARRHQRSPAFERGSRLRLLGTLGAVLGPRLLPILHALQVERAPHDVVAHPRQVLHPATADKHDRVLLEVVALAADVADDLEAVGETDLRHLAQRRVRLLRGGGVDASADPAALRAVLQRRALALDQGRFTTLSHELVDGRHPGLPESCLRPATLRSWRGPHAPFTATGQ